MTNHVIRIAAALILDKQGALLAVRKRGTSAFLLPGGKIDPGETPSETLCRELHEELGLTVTPDALIPLGLHNAPAANEPGHVVEAALFALAGPVSPVAQAEIEEARWIDLDEPGVPLAPLMCAAVFPLARRLRERA